jgi:hypothetical protein
MPLPGRPVAFREGAEISWAFGRERKETGARGLAGHGVPGVRRRSRSGALPPPSQPLRLLGTGLRLLEEALALLLA